MKKIQLLTLIIIISLPGKKNFAEPGTWKTVIDKNGIRVSTRPVSGSPVEEFRAVANIKTSLDTLGNVMKDIPAQTRWIADCIHAETIRKPGKHILIIYSVYKTPWPVSNRDTVIRTVTAVDPGHNWFTIDMDAVNTPLVPRKSGLVRITRMKGRWDFRKSAAGTVRVTYSLLVDPAGSIPAWLANRTSRQTPYTTLLNLKKMVKLKKYDH